MRPITLLSLVLVGLVLWYVALLSVFASAWKGISA